MDQPRLDTSEILALWLMQGMTSTNIRALASGGSTFDEIVRAHPETLAAQGLRRAAIASLSSAREALEHAGAQMARADAAGAHVITYWDDRYPAGLREIYAPPIVLFCLGDPVDSDEHAVAIVGTRGATLYGRLSAERYARECAQAGVTVVSGLARGIDIYAHVAALEAGGRTIACIASGLDAISPVSSAQLARRIARDGYVLTEHAFGVKALPAYFPQRNRIVAGISRGTVIIESDEKGGALITAGFALDYNREVFALPGPVTSPKSRGTNLLIRTDRARLTQSPVDVLDALGYHVALDERATSTDVAQLSLFEQQIFDALGAEPRHVDELCDMTGLPASEMLVGLLSLEFKGLARQMAGKMFLRA